jgi:heat shock protein HslJ
MIVGGIATLALGVVAVCAGPLTAADLQGTWELVEIGSRPVPPTAATALPAFTIKRQSIEGFDGCNNFSGRLDKPGSVVSTRRGCLDDVVKLPLDLTDPLAHLLAGKVQNDTLVLPARAGTAASVFRRVKSTPE